jgi:protein-histidine N-methyltransferase
LPSCSVFAKLLEELSKAPSDPDGPPPKVTRIHLQDYNQQGASSHRQTQLVETDKIYCPVLSLITLPNLLLTYAQHLASESPSTVTLTGEDAEVNPGELDVTPEFLESFESLLQRENVELRFFEGDWSGMVAQPEVQHYDVVLTSETIYSLDSLPSLLSLLQTTCRTTSDHPSPATCLVACKRIYFGVGGGELEFRRRVEERGGKVSSIWGEGEGEGKSQGVGRVVMNVNWN